MLPGTSWRKWNSRMIAWGLMVALLPLAAVAVALHVAYQQVASELIIERDRQLTTLSAARLQDEFLNVAAVLSALARTPDIYRRNVADQQAALERAKLRVAAFDAGVVLLDSFGTVRATVPQRPEILLQDWSDRRFFQALLVSSEIAFSDGINDGPNGSMVTIIGVPIHNEKGELVGALAGMFDLSRSTVSSFYASIVRLRIGQSGTTYVVDSAGRILYDSNYAQIGEMFNASMLPVGALQGIGGAIRTRDTEGHRVIAAYVPVPQAGWTLITEDDWAALTRTTRNYSNTLLALLAVGTMLPVAGVVLLMRQRHSEMHEQEEYDQAMQVASLVRQSLFPKHAPMLPGWNLTVHYQPASIIGGDFYDFVVLPDGRLMLAVGDVADNSATGALMTATTRATLRGAALHSLPPSAALAQGNELLCPEVQAGQSVSCLYSILDPSNGKLEFAGAGHALSYYRSNGSMHELNISGQPLGLVLNTQYEQDEVTIRPGELMLFVTDGLISAHNSEGEPFGIPRLKAVLEKGTSSAPALVDAMVSELQGFIGDRGQQEDDITLVVLERTAETQPA
jgi:serine phosphatase RsbU (regulator of sigma subunit)